MMRKLIFHVFLLDARKQDENDLIEYCTDQIHDRLIKEKVNCSFEDCGGVTTLANLIHMELGKNNPNLSDNVIVEVSMMVNDSDHSYEDLKLAIYYREKDIK